MRKTILFTLLFVCSIITKAQTLHGKITDTKGNPIAFASIYTSKISKGTTSNIEGNYTLDLPFGTHHLTIRYLGYKTKEINVQYSKANQKLDIQLEEQMFRIPEVRILANGEDPAYSIMRKAIAMSYYYLNQVEDYKCRIYLKGSGKVTKIPRMIEKTLKKEGIEKGKTIVIENITDIHFKLPDILEENIISMRSTLKQEQISPMSYLTISLYQDDFEMKSPLCRDAFSYYKFELTSSFYDQDYLIHKIKVTPRRKGYDLYSGYICLVEGFWHLHSVELELKQKMFTLKINQIYNPVAKDVWMPVSHNMDMDIDMLGVAFSYKYVASVSNYQVKLNSQLDHSVYQNLLTKSKQQIKEENQIHELVKKEYISKKESRKLQKMVRKKVHKSIPKKDLEIKDSKHVNDSANMRSIAYWDSIRPIPLTINEIDEYKIKDSIQLRLETDSLYCDSIKRNKKRFKWGKLITGGRFKLNKEHSIKYKGTINLAHLNYNTIDGLQYGTDLSYSYKTDKGKLFRVKYDIDYAFAREKTYNNLSLLYRYNGQKRASVNLTGGRTVSDFNTKTGINYILNAATTLFLKENHLKLYQKDYLNFHHKFDIVNGLSIEYNLEYTKRKQLRNHSNFNILNLSKKEFTPNVPIHQDISYTLVNDHTASIASLEISYTPEFYYKMINGVKVNLYSRYPNFRFKYTKGIKNLLQSDVSFDQIEFSINQGHDIRRLGYFEYQITSGAFLNSKSTYFTDYKHFNTNKPFLIGTEQMDAFRSIDYYQYSTNKKYVEIHSQIECDRILLKRLPILNKTLMNESIYFNYLATSNTKPYYEIGYSLNRIFFVFNAEIFAGFKGSNFEYGGFKIGFPLF